MLMGLLDGTFDPTALSTDAFVNGGEREFMKNIVRLLTDIVTTLNAIAAAHNVHTHLSSGAAGQTSGPASDAAGVAAVTPQVLGTNSTVPEVQGSA